jgi:hypothetical protein
MKITRLQLEHLVREMRATAGSLEVAIETLSDLGVDSAHYADDSRISRLAVILDVASEG